MTSLLRLAAAIIGLINSQKFKLLLVHDFFDANAPAEGWILRNFRSVQHSVRVEKTGRWLCFRFGFNSTFMMHCKHNRSWHKAQYILTLKHKTNRKTMKAIKQIRYQAESTAKEEKWVSRRVLKNQHNLSWNFVYTVVPPGAASQLTWGTKHEQMGEGFKNKSKNLKMNSKIQAASGGTREWERWALSSRFHSKDALPHSGPTRDVQWKTGWFHNKVQCSNPAETCHTRNGFAFANCPRWKNLDLITALICQSCLKLLSI